MFPLSGVRPDLQLGVAVSLLDALYVPLRKRVAAARFEEAKLRVTGAVLDFAAQVRTAFYVHQANEQMVELRQTIAQALGASLEVSRRLHEAGNISDLDLARDRAQTEASKVMLRAAEVDARQSREQLNGLMGAWGDATTWEIDGRMPDIPAEPLHVMASSASRSREASISRTPGNGSSRRASNWDSTGRRPWSRTWTSGRARRRKAERPGRWGRWSRSPFHSSIRGKRGSRRAAAELRRAQQEYYALAVRIRATARAVQDRLAGARDRALYYRDILLPLRERIVNEGATALQRDADRDLPAAAGSRAADRDRRRLRGGASRLLAGPGRPGADRERSPARADWRTGRRRAAGR